MKALEDKWVDARGPINDIISRCANRPRGSKAIQQILFAQKQKMRRFRKFLEVHKGLDAERASSDYVERQHFVIPNGMAEEFVRMCTSRMNCRKFL